MSEGSLNKQGIKKYLPKDMKELTDFANKVATLTHKQPMDTTALLTNYVGKQKLATRSQHGQVPVTDKLSNYYKSQSLY
jgi:thiaminase